MSWWQFYPVPIVLLSIFLALPLNGPNHVPIADCELDKCPHCYGVDLCDRITQKQINYTSSSLFRTFLSAKNVHFATDALRGPVVLKKLAHAAELRDHFAHGPPPPNVDGAIRAALTSAEFSAFRLCPAAAIDAFVAAARRRFTPETIWTLLTVNAEPIVLELFGGFALPTYHGACGLLTAQSFAGRPINEFENAEWLVRASFAEQLLHAALQFTDAHALYRLYLTDISPDNIVVDSNHKVRFIDMENVILVSKVDSKLSNNHTSEYYVSEGFAYSEAEICASALSDHNLYGVCRFILSKGAPWPMMQGGLLHDPPLGDAAVDRLLTMVENCAKSRHLRFDIARQAIDLIRTISQNI